MNQNHLNPSTTTSVVVDPSELPDGFTTVDPNDQHSSSSHHPHQHDELQRQAMIQEQKQMILEQAMDSDALARLGRIKMVKPDKAAMVENTIIAMTMQGRLPPDGRITEGKLIEILERSHRKEATAATQSSNSINIQRKNYAMDSDDDDDDDDDDV
jgi:programmed cell death protein 5